MHKTSAERFDGLHRAHLDEFLARSATQPAVCAAAVLHALPTRARGAFLVLDALHKGVSHLVFKLFMWRVHVCI